LESQLRPREIQARIRAGASVEQVAAAAGVPLQKIERFAYPVLLERSRTAEVAQRAHPMRADGPDTRMLGDVVAHTFGLRGQEYTDAEWDSWKGEDGKWVVALSWRAGRSDNRAHWTFQPGAHGGTVTAVDEHASDLVEGLPLRPLRTVGPVIDMARPEDPAPAPATGRGEELRAAASDGVRGSRIDPPAAEARTVERAPARSAPEPRRQASPPQRQAPVEPPRAEPAAPEPSRPEPARPEPTRPEPARSEPARPERDRVEPTTDQPRDRRPAQEDAVPAPSTPQERTERHRPEPDAADRAPASRPDRRRSEPAANSEPATAEAPAPEESAESPAPEPAPEPPAPAAEPPAAAQQPGGNRRTKKGKPVMPSWDEVLLGVRGQR
jgi:hypothetical protein